MIEPAGHADPRLLDWLLQIDAVVADEREEAEKRAVQEAQRGR